MSARGSRRRRVALRCQSCGRLLCEAHRNQHTCETEDAEFERKRRMDVGAIRDEIKRQEDAKDAAREAEAAEKRLLNEKKAAVWLAWKERRKHVAGRAKIKLRSRPA